jgi:uncharacterized protein YfiM (DUF2279 family)
MAPDKLSHFSVSVWIVGAAYYTNRYWFSNDKTASRATAVCLSISAGLLKEIWDGRTSYFSRKDLVVDILGTVFGLVVFTLNEP